MTPINDPAHYSALIEHIPFAAIFLGTRRADRPLLTRLLEQVAVAVAAATIGLAINDARQDEQLTTIKTAIAALTARVDTLHPLQPQHHTTSHHATQTNRQKITSP